MDVAIAGAALAAALPLMTCAAAMIALEDGFPLLYKQIRVGKGGEPFQMLKFRSLRNNDMTVDQVGQVWEDHPLVTRVGKVIRRFKIDELPQLVNVLLGEMSVVGPRPTVQEQVDRYTPLQRRRLEVRPGITGWAQVNGGTAFSWNDRILLDIWYIDHFSLMLDVRILLRTLGVVLGGERADHDALGEARDHAAGLAALRAA